MQLVLFLEVLKNFIYYLFKIKHLQSNKQFTILLILEVKLQTTRKAIQTP